MKTISHSVQCSSCNSELSGIEKDANWQQESNENSWECFECLPALMVKLFDDDRETECRFCNRPLTFEQVQQEYDCCDSCMDRRERGEDMYW